MEQKLTHVSEARDWSPNITNLNEQLLLGPQREILELIQEINRRWTLDLNATKTYRWGPGYMDKIKRWYRDHYVEEHMKRKISTFFNKVAEKHWSVKELEKKLRVVDEKMASRRRNGAVFQDNSGLLEEKLEILSNRVESQLSEANKQFNSSGIHINASLYRYQNTNRYDAAIKDEYVIQVSLPPGKMNLFVGDTPYQIEIGGSIIWFRLDLMKLIYTICNENSRIVNDNTFKLNYTPYAETGSKIIAHYFPEWEENSEGKELKHPYISGRNAWNQLRINDELIGSHVCLGELTGHVDRQMKKLDLVSLCATLMLWNSTFHIGRTHPLNQIKKVFWGISPENNTDEFKNAVNMVSAGDCEHNNWDDRSNIDTMYCDETQCVFRDSCTTYRVGMDVDQEEPQEEPSVGGVIEVLQAMEEDSREINAQRTEIEERMRQENPNGQIDVDEVARWIELETPEERVIRWAAENGGAINIGER
tara:strand:- start:232 stop:1662 length:1431 start_codon:yes stop_codon:yes gene_type:complete